MKLFQRLRSKERSRSPSDAGRPRSSSLNLLSIADEQTARYSTSQGPDSPTTRKASGTFSITGKSTLRDLDRKRSFPFLRPSFSKHATIVTTDTPAETLCPSSPVRPRHALALERPGNPQPSASEPLSAGTTPSPSPPMPRTTRWREKVSSRPTTAKRPATADTSAAGNGPPMPFGSTKIQRHLTSTNSKAAGEMQELDRKLSKDVVRIAGHLGPPPAGFEEDAFDERIDLIKALVSCHATAATGQEATPQYRRGVTAAEILERIEVRLEKMLRSQLAEGQTDRESIESLRLPMAFATARQQCGLSAKASNFKLFTEPPSPKAGLGLGLGLGLPTYPEIAPRRSSREFCPAPPATVRHQPVYVPATFGEALDALHPMHSLTPAPRRRRRPTTAPDSNGGRPPPFRSPSRQSARTDASSPRNESRRLTPANSIDAPATSSVRMVRSGSASSSTIDRERPATGRIPFVPRHEAVPRRERAASVGRAGTMGMTVPIKPQRTTAMVEELPTPSPSPSPSPPRAAAALSTGCSDGDGCSSDFTLNDAPASGAGPASLTSASASSHRTLAVLDMVDGSSDKAHIYPVSVATGMTQPAWAR